MLLFLGAKVSVSIF